MSGHVEAASGGLAAYNNTLTWRCTSVRADLALARKLQAEEDARARGAGAKANGKDGGTADAEAGAEEIDAGKTGTDRLGVWEAD